jgi:pimeloyl-ACP methyl ester carboxylesterase
VRRRGTGLTTAAFLAAALLLLAGCGGGGRRTHTVVTSPRPDGQVNVQTVTYRSSFDGSRVAALVSTPRAVASRGCVIWEFGFGSTKADSSLVSQGFASLGLTTVSIDFHYPGARSSSPSETDQVLTNPTVLPKLIRGTVGDLHSLIDYLEQQPYCLRNIAYGGVSLGGAIGTILAATDQRVKAAVLIVTPGSWRGVRPADPGVARRPRVLATFARLLSPLDPARFIGRISPRPVLILSGIDDQTVPLANARALQAAARRPKTIIDYVGGHNPAENADASTDAQDVASFLLRNIVEPTYGITAKANGTFSRP